MDMSRLNCRTGLSYPDQFSRSATAIHAPVKFRQPGEAGLENLHACLSTATRRPAQDLIVRHPVGAWYFGHAAFAYRCRSVQIKKLVGGDQDLTETLPSREVRVRIATNE